MLIVSVPVTKQARERFCSIASATASWRVPEKNISNLRIGGIK